MLQFRFQTLFAGSVQIYTFYCYVNVNDESQFYLALY